MDRLEWNDFPPEEEKEKTSFGQVLSRCISLRRLFLRSFSLDWFYSYLKEEGSTSDNSTRCVSSTLKKEDFLLELVRLNQETFKTFKYDEGDLFHTYEYTCKQLLQVCYIFKESCLQLVLEAGTEAHTYLDTEHDGSRWVFIRVYKFGKT